MVELILTVCAIVNAQNCHDERFKLNDDISLIQCMMSVSLIPQIIEWQKDHPDWHVTSWTCRSYTPEKDV